MNKLILVLLLVAVANQTKSNDQMTLGRELKLEEAFHLSVDRFNCEMEPRFYDFVIQELFKWIDIIDNQQKLQTDLQIIEQIVKLVEKVKHIEGIQKEMFLHISQRLSSSVSEMSLAQVESKWAKYSIDEIQQQMREFSQVTTQSERATKANTIIKNLYNMEQQLQQYLNQSYQYQNSQELYKKIEELKNKQQYCESQYPKEYTGSTRLQPGRSDLAASDDPKFDNQSSHQQAANQDKPFQSNPNYQGGQKEPRQPSTRLPPGRYDQPESNDPKFDNQSSHQQAANQDKPFQSNPNYQGGQKEPRQPSTRLPPGRYDQPESNDPKFDNQSSHQQAANQDKPFQSNPNYQGGQKEPRQPSTRLPPGRYDQPESNDPKFDNQSSHQQAANQDKPFQSNPNYQGGQKEPRQPSTRLPPGRYDQPESNDPKFDNQSSHQQAANQDKPFQSNPNYQGGQKEPRQPSTRLPPGRYDQPESNDPKFDNQSSHQQAANQDKPFQSNPNYQGGQKEPRQPSTRLPPGRYDQPESNDPKFDNQSSHQQAANQDKPFQSNPNYQGGQKEPRQPSTRLPPGRYDQPESNDPKFDNQSSHQQAANQDQPFQSNPKYKQLRHQKIVHLPDENEGDISIAFEDQVCPQGEEDDTPFNDIIDDEGEHSQQIEQDSEEEEEKNEIEEEEQQEIEEEEEKELEEEQLNEIESQNNEQQDDQQNTEDTRQEQQEEPEVEEEVIVKKSSSKLKSEKPAQSSQEEEIKEEGIVKNAKSGSQPPKPSQQEEPKVEEEVIVKKSSSKLKSEKPTQSSKQEELKEEGIVKNSKSGSQPPKPGQQEEPKVEEEAIVRKSSSKLKSEKPAQSSQQEESKVEEEVIVKKSNPKLQAQMPAKQSASKSNDSQQQPKAQAQKPSQLADEEHESKDEDASSEPIHQQVKDDEEQKNEDMNTETQESSKQEDGDYYSDEQSKEPEGGVVSTEEGKEDYVEVEVEVEEEVPDGKGGKKKLKKMVKKLVKKTKQQFAKLGKNNKKQSLKKSNSSKSANDPTEQSKNEGEIPLTNSAPASKTISKKILFNSGSDTQMEVEGEDNSQTGSEMEDNYIYYQEFDDKIIYYEFDPVNNAFKKSSVVQKTKNQRSLIIQSWDDLLDSTSSDDNKDNDEKQEGDKQTGINQDEQKQQQNKKTQDQSQQQQDNSQKNQSQEGLQSDTNGQNQKEQQPDQVVSDILKNEKAKVEETSQENKEISKEINKEKSIKIHSLKDEYNANEPTQYSPPKHKINTRPSQEKIIIPVSTKYVQSAFDGEAAEQYEFADREMLQDSDEYGYGFWLRYTESAPKLHSRQAQTFYFISRLTSNQDYRDFTFYGDRTLSIFLFENTFVFSTYDHGDRKKVKDSVIALNEELESMWYFITFSYSLAKKSAIGFVLGYGNNGKILKTEISCLHVPPTYFKLIIGGKHLSYQGFNGQFANIFYDIDAPAFIDSEQKLNELIKTISNPPQAVNSLTDLEVLTTPKQLSANSKGDSQELNPQESSLIIEEYSIAGWFRWIDDLKVDEQNTFQIFNLRSTQKKQPNKGVLGDRTLEIHYTYGGGAKSTVYFNTYTIQGNKAKGTSYISKNVESPNLIWTYVYFGYDNDKLKAYGALIRPGKADEVILDPIQHKLVTKLYFTIGGDEQISSFNGKIGYVGIYLGPGAFRSSLDFGQQFFYGDGAVGVYQLVKPIQYKDDAQDPNLVRDSQYDAEQPIVDKILLHDDSKLRLNGQSEYSFGLWTRWLQTLPKFLAQRGAVHNIARFGTAPYLIEQVEGKLKRANTRPSTEKDQTLAVTLSKDAYEFYTYKAKDEIEFNNIEGSWNYVYFGYKRVGTNGIAKGYVQFGLEGEIKEIVFDILHDFLLEYVEFVIGKSQAPLFNGQLCKIQCSIGPGSFISTADDLKLYTQNSLPDKAQIRPISRQTQQLIGTPVDQPSQKFQFDKFQGIKEYSISGWVKWSGAQKLGKTFHIASMAQKKIDDLNGNFEQTLQILRSDQSYTFNTYSCKGDDCSGIVTQDQQLGEYWDQWTYIYYGYSQVMKKTFGYVKFTFTDSKFNQDQVTHFYVAVFSIIISSEQQKFQGSMKTWVINVGEGSYREGNFVSDENIKVHFGFVSGTDHIKLEQAGQEAHHVEQVLECGSNEKDVPLHVQFEQSDKLHLHGVSEYGYGFWARFQHYGKKGILYQQPQWMGLARLTTQKDYKDFEQPGDRVLLILQGKGVHHFSTYNVQPQSNNINGNIPYLIESESEWTYIYFSYKRISQTVGHAVAFTSYNDITAGIQMDVLHNLLQNYLQLTVGHAGKFYPNFNGQITTVRFNLGPGAFIDNKQGILGRIKNKDPKPEIISNQKQFEIIAGKQDATNLKIENPIVIEQEAREYSVQLWFRWFKTATKPNQVIYRLTSNKGEDDAKNIGDKVLMLSHIGTALFSTYSLQDQTLNIPYECNIPKQQLEIWTFAYFAYSKKERKIQYYLKADTHENKGLEPVLHAVASKYLLFVARDGFLENFSSRLAQLTVNFGDGAFRNDNFLQLPVYILGPKLFSQEKVHKWERSEKLILGQSQTIRFNDQPDKPIESMQEYSIGFWCRFLQAWPERLYRLPLEMQLVRLTYNEKLEVGKVAIGDRILASHLIQSGFQFSTYDLNDDAPNELHQIPNQRIEGQWHYIYMGYIRSKQVASFFVYNGQDMQSAKNQDALHKPLGDFVILHIGGEPEVPSFQGIMSKIALSFGPGSFFSLVEEVKKTIDNSYALDQSLTVGFIHKEKHGQQELIGKLESVTDEIGGTELKGETWSTVGEYAISGWFKTSQVNGQSANDCQVLFRVTNNDREHLNDKRSQGDRTLFASICVDSLKLSTYTLSGLKDWNEAKFLEENVPLGHNKRAWIYIYMGYNEDLQEVHALVHLFEEDKPLIFKGVQHFVPHYTGIYVAKDPFTKRFQGEIQKWVASYGFGAFVSVQKRGYEDLLLNYNALAINQKYMWFKKEDQVVETEQAVIQEFSQEVESVDEYSIGLWTRWLISFPSTLTERQPQHNIFRFSSNKQDQDKSELGDRVLAAYLTIGNYEFSTYDVNKPSNAMDAKLPYVELEGSWTYIYAAYKSGQFYGMVLFREQQKAQHVELQVQHRALTGYAKFVMGAKEFGRKGFHGWLFDPRIFLGTGAFINEGQKVVDMVLKLHRKLPVPALDAEDFKWPVNIIDTTLPDDINEKKDKFQFAFTNKVGLLEYSFGFWMQNGVLQPEMPDDLRGLVRLTTNNEGSDERYIGDRTLAVFTKVQQLVACTYTLKDPSFEPVSHQFDLIPYQWTYVYFGYTQGKARAYVLSIKGPSEQIFSVKHAVPNAFYLNIIKDQSHPLFYGKFYGLKVNFGQGSYLENPQEMIEKWPYDPKTLPVPEPKEEKVLALNSAKVDRAPNTQHEQFKE
ncbi:unnamed protein product [Paramecium pentaurelia]|uniref:Uncharacterized protein n=1 Tax=Paramecium pentaurelia TaxID=43138 RepID=A0A8S1SZ46_9CILI|nr:unnamed protein product [Paramecium pentaurelia]